MKCREKLDSDSFVELRECPLVTVLRSDIVAGGKSMLRIEANPQAFTLFRGVDDATDLLEAITEVRALAGGDLQGDFHIIAGTSRMNFIKRFCDGLDSLRFTRADMRAGVRDKVRNAESLTTFQFIDECGHRSIT